jgi:hypothetical protein
MKNISISRIKVLGVMIGVVMLMGSCSYDMLKDTAWPDQLIYMPAAMYNNYMINTVPSAIGAVPTPGYPIRFGVDTINRKFNVFLGVYRSGIDCKGEFNVDIAVNTDTINKLLAITGKLPTGTILLPADKYTVPSSVQMADGGEIAKFDLVVDLDYLRANYSPTGNNFAIAVTISSAARKTNPKLATTIIVIDTKILKPVSNFTSVASTTNAKEIKFTNTTLYGTKFMWDFGDGVTQTTTNMVNVAVSHIYSAAGTYNVTLTTIGVTDLTDKSVLTKAQVVL